MTDQNLSAVPQVNAHGRVSGTHRARVSLLACR